MVQYVAIATQESEELQKIIFLKVKPVIESEDLIKFVFNVMKKKKLIF